MGGTMALPGRRLTRMVSGVLAGSVATLLVGTSAAASGGSGPIVVDDSALKALTTTVGGASVLNSTQTVQHWFDQATNPINGVKYGYNMVGANPNTCSGSSCSVTIQADITPVIVNIDGLTFSGSDVLPATLASPVFATNDYGSTTAATIPGPTIVPPPPSLPFPSLIQGPGGSLSQGDAGVSLQLEDATMRAQFNQIGTSPYHLMLNPNVLPAVTIDVPSSQGVLLTRGSTGVTVADVNITW